MRVRLRDPDGVVAAVPYLLGFTPRRSLVVIGIDDHQGVGPTLRCDLDPAGPPDLLRQAWAGAVRTLRRNDCTTGLVVLYTDTEPADLAAPLRDRLLEQILGPSGPEALDVLDVLAVGPTRFTSLGCVDPTCCPSEGRPVVDVGSHPVAAAFVLAGRSPAPDREALEPVAEATQEDKEVALEAAASARSRRPVGTRARGARTGSGAARRLMQEWVDCLPDGPDPRLAGRLAAAWTTEPHVRDACMAAVLPGGTPAAAALLEGRADAAALLDVALRDPGSAVAVDGAVPALRRLAALSAGPDRATVLGAHAWLAWVGGDGTAAGILADRALDEESSQSLARLVLRCLDSGLGAPWTTRPRPARLRFLGPDDGSAVA